MGAQPPYKPPHTLPPRWSVRETVQHPPKRHRQRWIWLGLLAILLHLPLVQLIFVFGDEPELVHVVSVSPAPGGTVNLLNEGPLEAVVVLDIADEERAPNPLGARLMRVHDDGVREIVGLGRLDPEDPHTLRFTVPRQRGQYQIWLAADGPEPIVHGDMRLDGELVGNGLPSGDAEVGGDFVMQFSVDEVVPVPETLVANITEETAENPAEEKLGEPEEQPTPEAAAKLESPIVKPTPTMERPAPQKPLPDRAVVDPSPTVRVENELPMRSKQPTPEKEAKVSDLFSIQAGDTEAIFGEEADQVAAERAAQRKKSGLLGGWEEEWARTKGTLEGSGPKVRPGNQKAVRTHRKEVWAYIAAMHKIIHQQWANNYLISLDLLTRSPTNPLNDPNLSTVLEIELDERGVVTDVQMVNTSGIATYDAEAIRIAWESGPKDPVPNSMLSPNGHAYLHWSFWRDQRQCGTFGVEVYVLDEKGRKGELDVDQEKIRQEEERIGVRTQGTGQPAPPTVPGPPVMSDPDEQGATPGPSRSGSTGAQPGRSSGPGQSGQHDKAQPGDDAKGGHEDADDKEEKDHRIQKRKRRLQTRERSLTD